MTSWEGLRVLVFEPEGPLATELRRELGMLGCVVWVVHDANSGLAQARAECPDVIIVSVELPRMSGFWVCTKLKKDARFRDVPLILLSKEATIATFEEHKKLKTRAEAYLHKPLEFDQLRSEIERQLAASQARSPAMTGEASGDAGGNGPYRDSERAVRESVPPPENSEPTPTWIDSLESRNRRTGIDPPAASASSTGWLLNGIAFGLTLVALTVATIPLVLLLPEGVQRVLVLTIHNARRGPTLLPVWALLLAVPLWVVPRILVARAWRREVAWVKALPFEVPDYARAMGTWDSDFKMNLEFVADTLDGDALHDYLDLKTGTWTFQIAGRSVTLARTPSLVSGSAASNRRLLLWFHALVNEKLLPLHQAHPIRSFSFRDRG